jgi:hypothetical protein
MNTKRRSNWFVILNGRKEKDFDKIKQKALDILNSWNDTTGDWVKKYVELEPRANEDTNKYKKRLQNLLSKKNDG